MNETLTSPGVITYWYDSAGDTISANSGGNISTYTYDYRNRLTQVTQGGTVIATYTYNALDQRIGIQESGGQTWTVYNGKNPDALPYADFNGSGTLLTRYVSGPGMVNGAVVDESSLCPDEFGGHVRVVLDRQPGFGAGYCEFWRGLSLITLFTTASGTS